MMKEKPVGYFDKTENVKKVLRIFYVICALLLSADLFIHRHVIHNWESLFGFYSVFGFVACVVLVLVAKQMRKLIMRGEDYYDK